MTEQELFMQIMNLTSKKEMKLRSDRILTEEKLLQSLFDGHFNEESITRRFRNNLATNYANTSAVFHISAKISLATTARVVLHNVSLGLGLKFKQLIYCGPTVI